MLASTITGTDYDHDRGIRNCGKLLEVITLMEVTRETPTGCGAKSRCDPLVAMWVLLYARSRGRTAARRGGWAV